MTTKRRNEETDNESDEFEVEDEMLMHTYATLPRECKKFWNKRYQLYSKYDEGVYMTSELWYSVTPEDISKFVAQLVKRLLPKAKSILDVCCGGGGNTIQFAKVFDNVGGIDINGTNIVCTEHNANIYGVRDKIWTLQGDWNQLCNRTDWIPHNLENKKQHRTFDFVFISPPWGGPSYNKSTDGFDVYMMSPLLLPDICQLVKKFTKNFGVFLPRTTPIADIEAINTSVFGRNKCRVIYVYQRDICKAILALFGSKMTQQVNYTEVLLTCITD